MGVFNPTDGSIHLKVVYYGPAHGGKTTNLSQVRDLLDPDGESALLSLETGADTTLFFDHLPLELRLLGRHVVRVQGYTVPGQVRYDRTRRLVLNGCDGVVFVADSSPDRMAENRDSWVNLQENLRQNGLNPASVPIVVQYNKRDLEDAASIGRLDAALEAPDRVCHLACAVNGGGVFESFRDLLLVVMQRAHEEFGLARYGLRGGDAVDALEEVLASARRSGVRSRSARSEGAESSERRVISPASGQAGSDALLEAAVQSSVELAELLGVVTAEKMAEVRRTTEILETAQCVVHDLRKPLVALTNSLWMLRRPGAVNDAAVAIAGGAVSELTDLLDECALRLRSAETPPDEIVDLDELVSGVLRRLAVMARTSRVELRLRGQFPRVFGHEATLASLVTNLIENGIKYRSAVLDVGRVEVTGRPQPDGAFSLLVADDGIGIPKGERRRVFEKHRRASNVSKVEGTGLGLYLARRVAHAHDARVGLRSAPERGTIVRLRFPACRVVTGEEEATGPPKSPRPLAPEPSAPSSARRGSS